MKYLVHYGYHECDGIKIFNSKNQVTQFLKQERSHYKQPKWGWFFDVYEVKSINKINDEFDDCR